LSLAIFDLDNTLLRGDSDYAWGRFLVENRIVDGEEYERENERYYNQYQAGTLDILEFLAFALRPLSQHDRATPAAHALVEKHRQQGDTLVIITATNRFVTAPIAREFEIENLIATEPEERHGRYTGKVDGTPCYREGKVTRLKNWIQQHHLTLKGSWFYSDSHNDLPLLSIVDHPVAVDPDETLRVEAGLRGWEIISLR
jgi:HAD superfamily phosphoserine phosphatase-like hydrolase